MTFLPISRVARDARGTSVVELALVAPFFAMMTLGTVDASRAVIEKLRLQQAAARTMEMASAGRSDSKTFIQNEAAAAANVDSSQVTPDIWLECDRVRQSDYNGTCTSTQEVARYASVSITNTYSPWFARSLAGLGWNVSRVITITGKASVRVQ